MLRQLYKSGKTCVRFISTRPAATLAVGRDTNANLLTKKTDCESSDSEEWDTALPFKAIPGPKEIPLLGNIWRFFPYIGEFYGTMDQTEFIKSFQKYGDIAALRGIGKDLVFVFDPSDIEKVFRNDGVWPLRRDLHSLTYYRKNIRNDIFQGMGTISTTNGKEWADIRSKVNPILLQSRAVDACLPLINEVATDFVARIRHLMKRNENGEMPEDFGNEIYKWALDSISFLALDRKLGCLANDFSQNSETQKVVNSLRLGFDLMVEFDMRPYYWKYFFPKKWKRFIEAVDYVTLSFYKFINEAKQKYHKKTNTSDKKSMLQILIETDSKLAVPMAMDLLGGGIDLAGKTACSTLYFLARNKTSQERLREELNKLLPKKNTKFTKGILAEAHYLKAVIKESQRLAPVGLCNLRILSKDLVLKGYQVPKGTDMLLCNCVPLWSEKQYPRPQEFIPERWLRENKGELSHKNAHPFSFLPFGFGPRSCVGKRIAQMEVEVLLGTVIRNFVIGWPHPPAKFEAKPFYAIASPLKFSFKEVQN